MQVYRYLEVGSCHWSYWDFPCWHAQAVISQSALINLINCAQLHIISRLQLTSNINISQYNVGKTVINHPCGNGLCLFYTYFIPIIQQCTSWGSLSHTQDMPHLLPSKKVSLRSRKRAELRQVWVDSDCAPINYGIYIIIYIYIYIHYMQIICQWQIYIHIYIYIHTHIYNYTHTHIYIYI